MDFYLLEQLDFENNEFKANEVILKNALIFNDYFYSASENTFRPPEKYPLPNRISHSDSIKIKGNMVLDSSNLLDKLIYYFYNIRSACSNEEISNYLNNRSSNADFDKKFINLNNYLYFHQEIDDKIINASIDFFSEFGFTDNTLDYISLIKLKYTIIPKILIISFVNTLYELISLFTFEDVEFDYNEEILESKFNEMVFITNLLLNRNNTTEYTFDIENINFLIQDFKVALLKIVNRYSLFLGPINLYSFSNFSDEKNKVIPMSNNIFSIAWYLLISKIQVSFEKGKFKKCEICRQNNVCKK